jgi:hypothetical protein
MTVRADGAPAPHSVYAGRLRRNAKYAWHYEGFAVNARGLSG